MQTRARVGFAADLRRHGERIAVRHGDRALTYDQLADRVDDVVDRLGPDRRLVLLAAGNDLDSLVGYLAALAAGHPVLLTAAGHAAHLDALLATYDPDVVIAPQVLERRSGSAHELHRDLALLLATSGSTGSSKLVRLSHRNLESNAEAIASYLAITGEDRAMTSLPMQYCYGLSVINSHLARGAGVILTDLSVVDSCFWDRFRAEGATSFAGVPYTFDLLDRIGFAELRLPTLRRVTQAGGRLAPERVRRYAELGRRDGWDFVVMYGQTEATARMAYLPPDRTVASAGAIGVPIPGGSFRIAPTGQDPAEGELHYRGPNVMLGYADAPTDLALGATVAELATGDIARLRPDGLYEIVGRTSRFTKLFGLRVDLDRVEAALAGRGIDAWCTGDDEVLVVAVATGVDAGRAARAVAEHTGLPACATHVVTPSELPRLPNGKPDYPSLRELARRERDVDEVASPVNRVRNVFAAVLQQRDVTDDSTFVGLGGDSLSYVETSIRLEAELGTLPDGWHTMPVRRLAQHARRPRRVTSVETNMLLRAAAIVLIVGNHTRTFHLPGGAHVLLGIAGFNFARFALGSGRMGRAIARIAVPSACWIGLVAATTDEFELPHALFLNAQLGAPGARWAYWFVEALVQILAVLGLLLAVPAVRRFERHRPVAAAVVVLLAGLAVRFDLLVVPGVGHRTSRPHEVLWLFAAGWVAARATSTRHRVVVSASLVVATVGFFGDAHREAMVLGGMLLLTWVPRVHVPRPVIRIAGLLAANSLYIYLTHWQVYPPLLERSAPTVAWLGSIVAGIVLGTGAQHLTTWAEARLARPLMAGAGAAVGEALAGHRHELPRVPVGLEREPQDAVGVAVADLAVR